MVCVLLGRVSVPFPENVKVACVWFIGVMFASDERSWKTGCGESSIPDEDDVGVAVVLLAVGVVVAATGVVVIILVADATIIAIASMEIVAARR
jgi:hypothetical protein